MHVHGLSQFLSFLHFSLRSAISARRRRHEGNPMRSAFPGRRTHRFENWVRKGRAPPARVASAAASRRSPVYHSQIPACSTLSIIAYKEPRISRHTHSRHTKDIPAASARTARPRTRPARTTAQPEPASAPRAQR